MQHTILTANNIASRTKKIIKIQVGLSATCAQDEIAAINNFMFIVTLGLGFFSSITLILGMLMIITLTTISIYERTKEIGIMKALGASDLNIMQSVLYECGLLGLISGILGMIGSILFAMVLDVFSKPIIEEYIGMQFMTGSQLTLIKPNILIIGFLLAFSISTLSGIYPVLRAAKLNPVDALKHF